MRLFSVPLYIVMAAASRLVGGVLMKDTQHNWTPRPPHSVTHSVMPSITSQSGPDMTQLLLLGKVEYGGGPIFKVVLEC